LTVANGFHIISAYRRRFAGSTEAIMDKQRIKIEQHGGLGLVWCAGWLFTLGYMDLGFWKGVLAIVIWPYYLGVQMAVPAVTG